MQGKADESQGLRLIPKVTFGLGAAILAGVAVVSVAPGASAAALTGMERVMTTAALGAGINAASGASLAGPESTCCSGQPPALTLGS
jgi:hypothetical protein